MAIKWEQVRTAWYTRTNEWQQVERCLERKRHLEAELVQAQRDAAAFAEHWPGERRAKIENDLLEQPRWAEDLLHSHCDICAITTSLKPFP